MFTAHIDLGQILIASLIGIIGFFVKKTIDDISAKLQRHEDILFRLTGEMQRIIGFKDGLLRWNGEERRDRS